jgi:hypothetical protein
VGVGQNADHADPHDWSIEVGDGVATTLFSFAY